MEKHLLGRVSAWCSVFFMKVWLWVFTHEVPTTSYRGDLIKTKLVWSISNMTKMIATAAVAIVSALFWLNTLNGRWNEGAVILVALDAILIGLWVAFFFRTVRCGCNWFDYVDVASEKTRKWYHLFLLASDRYPLMRKSAECYFIPILTVSVLSLVVRFWDVAAVLAVFALGVYLLKIISDRRHRNSQNRYFMKLHHGLMEEKAAALKVENERRLAVYPAVLSERDMLRSKYLELVENLIRAKMLIIASKVDGARSKYLAEARFALDTALTQAVGALTQMEIDLIELRVCRELGVAPEKHVPTVVAS
jgi:hypothetical protein